MSSEDKKENEQENKNKIEESDKSQSNIIENMPLNSTWTFWYASRKEKDHHIPYSDRLTKIAEFNNLQDFFKLATKSKNLTNDEKKRINSFKMKTLKKIILT